MSFSDRRRILGLLCAAPLGACGFTPVYGPQGAGNALRERLRIEPPDTRLEFVMVARLEDRLGRSSSPTHVLTYTLDTRDSNLAITDADDITRVNINGTLDFTVTDGATDQPVQTGTVTTFTAYSTTGSPVATVAARRDAEDRLMIALADQLVARLLSAAPGWA